MATISVTSSPARSRSFSIPYMESPLVAATSKSGSTTARKQRSWSTEKPKRRGQRSRPNSVTPSPPSKEATEEENPNGSATESARRPRVLVFPPGTNRKEKHSRTKGSNKVHTGSTHAASACSSAPRIPIEQAFDNLKKSPNRSKPLTPEELLPEIYNRKRSASVRKRNRRTKMSDCGLASLSGVEIAYAPVIKKRSNGTKKTKSTRKPQPKADILSTLDSKPLKNAPEQKKLPPEQKKLPPKNPKKRTKRSDTTSSALSMPPGIADILGPATPLKRIQTLEELLQEDEQSSTRKIMPKRAAKTNRRNYSDSSDDEAGKTHQSEASDDLKDDSSDDRYSIPEIVRPRRKPSSVAASPADRGAVHHDVIQPENDRINQREDTAAIGGGSNAVVLRGSNTTIPNTESPGSPSVASGTQGSPSVASSTKGSRKRKKKRSRDSDSTAIQSIIKVAKTRSPSRGKHKSKVRFAPSTTTFSVKVSVKTSSSRRRKGKKKSKTDSSALSEAAVQSIASSIAEACIAQAGSPDDDSDDEEEQRNTTESSETMSSTSESDSTARGKRPHCEKGAIVNVNKGDSIGLANVVPGDEDITDDEGISVVTEVSKLSMADWTGNDGSGIARDERKRIRETKVAELPDFPDVGDDGDYPDAQAEEEDHENPEENIGHRSPLSMSPRHRASSALETIGVRTPAENVARAPSAPRDHGGRKHALNPSRDWPPPKKRRRRQHACTDSLAGLSLASSAKTSTAQDEVPFEVQCSASRRRKKRLTLKARNGKKLSQQKRAAVAAARRRVKQGGSVSSTRSNIGSSFAKRSLASNVGAAMVSPRPLAESDRSTPSEQNKIVVRTKKKKRLGGATRGQKGPCGECSGCKMDIDCMRCQNCLDRLRNGVRSVETECLNRGCIHVRRFRQSDSLGGRRDANDDDHDDNDHTSVVVDHGEDDIASRTGSMYSAVSASSQYKTRSLRLWDEKSKQYQRAAAAAQESSLQTTPRRRGNSRGDGLMRIGAASLKTNKSKKKNEKSFAHNLQMPFPKERSMASWLESRSYLRAIKRYDEADQDWV